MILVDTSVWVEHIRHSNRELVQSLENDRVLVHPFVLGEIALGHLQKRAETIRDLRQLPQACLASDDEALTWLENKRLYGKGVGWVDLHLLLSCLLEDAKLWTLDKKLLSAARLCGVKSFEENAP